MPPPTVIKDYLDDNGIVALHTTAIFTVVQGNELPGADPGLYVKSSKTPNQNLLRLIAGCAFWLSRGRVDLARPYIDEFVRQGEIQRAEGFMTAGDDGTPEAPGKWNNCEQLTTTHGPQWDTAYYGALWLGLHFSVPELVTEANWYISAQLFFYGLLDPDETGRVIGPCARAKGTQHKGKPPKPSTVESDIRNQVWLMSLGRPRTDTKKNRNRFVYGADCVNVLWRCLGKKGWTWPTPKATKLMAPMRIAREGPIIEASVPFTPIREWVRVNGVELTRYNVETGEVWHLDAGAE